MICAFCSSTETDVTNSRGRARGRHIWRRRRCPNCQQTFTTYEKADLSFIEVQKRSGKLEPYTRVKLFASILDACRNLPETLTSVDALTDTAEHHLLDLKKTVITHEEIADIVLGVLKRFNTGAFVRYLSATQAFANNQELQKTIRKY